MWLEILQDVIIMCKKFTSTTKSFTISYTLTIYLAFYETEEWNYHQCTYNSKIKDKKKAAKYSPLGLFLNFGIIDLNDCMPCPQITQAIRKWYPKVTIPLGYFLDFKTHITRSFECFLLCNYTSTSFLIKVLDLCETFWF